MGNVNLQIEDIKEAYQKLKTHVYYDNYNLNLRVKLAEFESRGLFEDVFSELIQNINNNHIDSYLSSINRYILPKKIARDKKTECKNNIVRNDECGLSYEIKIGDEDYNFYIDAPIELHLLDTLWIMKEGCFLIDDNIKKDCYGNTLVYESRDSNNIKKGAYLFERYFDKYQRWRDKGIKIAREQTKHNNDVLLVCLDIQRFYPTSQINFTKIIEKLESRNINTDLTRLLQKIYTKYQSFFDKEKKSKLKLYLPASNIKEISLDNLKIKYLDLFSSMYQKQNNDLMRAIY